MSTNIDETKQEGQDTGINLDKIRRSHREANMALIEENMTHEEMLKHLQTNKGYYSEEFQVALRMAIKKLKKMEAA